jgi:competence protein ComGC
MVKKAYMKTIEMLLVMVISTIFLLLILPKQNYRESMQKESYLIHLEKDETFRDFVTGNIGCYNSTPKNTITVLVEKHIPKEFDYTICIDKTPRTLPIKDIFIDSLVIAGNYSQTEFKTIRLYYWSE